jgi:hypothetical protein
MTRKDLVKLQWMTRKIGSRARITPDIQLKVIGRILPLLQDIRSTGRVMTIPFPAIKNGDPISAQGIHRQPSRPHSSAAKKLAPARCRLRQVRVQCRAIGKFGGSPRRKI